ncbi:MAG: N-acetylglucosamine-6-phosphate deacetylase [Vicinamibacterales bacterium]
MIVLAGGDIVRSDAIVPFQTIVVENGRIARIQPAQGGSGDGGGSGAGDAGGGDGGAVVHGIEHHLVVPGFIDVHVHGVAGVDVLDRDDDAVARIAAALPRFGVTAFCPTTVACEPGDLRKVLGRIRRAREHPDPASARVLPAHLESNFINPSRRGAQPSGCLRTAAGLLSPDAASDDTAEKVLREIDSASADVAIVTMAPELEGGIALIRWLRERGIRVSLGHSDATFEEAEAAIAAGANQATHLFNCMPALNHREPGLAGAVLRSPEIIAELVCDGVHLHPAIVRMAVAAKTPARIMAITDGTAASALPEGESAHLGGRAIAVRGGAARLADGTLAGSVLTMDRAFRMLIDEAGCSPVEAAHMCSTTPARALGLTGHGLIAEGAAADLAVLDRSGEVVQTYVAGRLVYSRPA